MIKWFLIVLIILVLLFIYIYNIINQNEDKVLFCPSKKKIWKPDIPYENIYLNCNDKKDFCYSKEDRKKGENYLSCWNFNNFSGRPYILYMHSNTGNLTHRSYIINFCNKFKLNLFLFDYSGYGESSGVPHKILLRENAETVFHFLHNICDVPSEKIIVWAESLGCLSSSFICSKYNCGGLILLAAFSSLDDVLIHQYKGYKQTASKFLTSILSYKMDFLPVKDYLRDVKCPVVIIHSKTDEIIPYECSKINFNSIKHHNKKMVTIKGGHSSPIIKTRQLREVFHFCNLPDDLSSGPIEHMLKNLETFAKKHNNFMSF